MKKFKNLMIIFPIFLVLILSIMLLKNETNNIVIEDDIKVKNNNLAIMIEKEAQTGKYEESESSSWPQNNYVINAKLSKCLNGSKLKYNSETNTVNVNTNKTDKCYLYFDNINVKSEFNYTGNYEEYVVPTTGTYKIELWGASGRSFNTTTSAGRGAYTKELIELEKGEILYVYVGNGHLSASNGKMSFNGGGIGEVPGGGATDVRLIKGNWDDFDSLKSRIMVAAGGGGSRYYAESYDPNEKRGDGGTLNGLDAKSLVFDSWNYSGHGATQISGGEPGSFFSGVDPVKLPEMTGGFGQGGYALHSNQLSYTSAGGGGGYYGGGHGNHAGSSWAGAGGGSSFISGYKGCVAIKEVSTKENIQPKDGCTDGTDDIECSYHYSGKVFTETQMIAGNAEMPKPDGGTEEGHIGAGYAKITFVK